MHFLEKLKDKEKKWILGLFGVVTLSSIAYLAYRNYKMYKDDSRIHPPSQIYAGSGTLPEIN